MCLRPTRQASAIRRKAPSVIIAAAVTASHHLEPRLAAITGIAIMANGTNQEKAPNTLKAGISDLMEFGASINSQMKAMQAIPIHPSASLRLRSNLIADSRLRGIEDSV
jgi:hypothetical protein